MLSINITYISYVCSQLPTAFKRLVIITVSMIAINKSQLLLILRLKKKFKCRFFWTLGIHDPIN